MTDSSNPEPASDGARDVIPADVLRDVQRPESRMSLKCRHCGWESSIYGTSGKAMLATLEDAHTLLRPECPTAKVVADV